MNTATQFVRENRITDAELESYRDITNPGRNVVSITDYDVEVGALLLGKEMAGDTLPWPKTHQHFRLRPGEVTLWHGINGHGKSAITTQLALYLALQSRFSCIASFEMLPERTLLRMVKQCAGSSQPSMQFMANFFITLCSRIWIYDRRGRIDPNLLFAAIRYCAEVKKTSHFFVDSLMKCVPGEDDYNRQKDFVGELCEVAKETQTHIHLVHHVRKGADEKGIPTKFDAKGSGAITDQVDNVLAVWRNKSKEKDDAKALEMGAALTAEGPDFLLICDKQRNGGWEGTWALWGDVRSWHFRETVKVPWDVGYALPERAQTAEPGSNG